MPFVSFETRAYKNNLDPSRVSPYGQIVAPGDVTDKVFSYKPYISPVVRRPTEGIELKERTPASLTIMQADGTAILLNNSAGNGAGGLVAKEHSFGNRMVPYGVGQEGLEKYYTDFTLLQVQESREEKMQVMQTFGEDFIFFFGEKTRFISCAGVFVNSLDFNWRTIWWENYDKYLRGTRCVEQRARVYLSYEDVVIEGYIVSANATDMADSPHQIPFRFTMLMTNYMSLAAANLDVMRSLRNGGNVLNSEFLSSRGLDVTSGGEYVDMDESFLGTQAMALFGTTSPEQAIALLSSGGAGQIGGNAGNLAGSNKGFMQDRAGVGLGGQKLPGQAPLGAVFGDATHNGKNLSNLAGKKGSSQVFGSSMEKTHSLSAVDFGSGLA